MTDTSVDHRVTPLPPGTKAPDFEPKGEVARACHVYRAEEGTSERALYVIDADGIVRWSYVSPVGVNPGADGILRALENLGTGGPS